MLKVVLRIRTRNHPGSRVLPLDIASTHVRLYVLSGNQGLPQIINCAVNIVLHSKGISGQCANEVMRIDYLPCCSVVV